jgi:hypothetical protein
MTMTKQRNTILCLGTPNCSISTVAAGCRTRQDSPLFVGQPEQDEENE